MTTSVVLLDPQRSALVSMAIEEGFLTAPRGIPLNATPTFQLGRSPRRRAEVMELAVLHDTLRLIHHENAGDVDALRQRGHDALSLLPLRATGLVQFDGKSPKATGLVLSQGISPSGFWKENWALVQPWIPVLVRHLVAKGVFESISHAQRYFKLLVIDNFKLDSEYPIEVHVVTMSTFGELLQAEAIGLSAGASCCQPLLKQSQTRREQSAPYRVMQIVVDELLGNELKLPVPSSIHEALKLQGDPNIEPPRVSRRLNTLRGLSHEQVEQVLARGA